MKTQTNTTSITKSKAAAHTVSSRKGKVGLAVQIDDNRQQSGKIAQLQEIADSSAGVAIQRLTAAGDMTQEEIEEMEKERGLDENNPAFIGPKKKKPKKNK